MHAAAPSSVRLSANGGTYAFQLCDGSNPWAKCAGLYSFIEVPGYIVRRIGETNSFFLRMPDHEDWERAQRFGATHIYAMRFPGAESERKALEKALIAEYNPVCNVQHRTTPPLPETLRDLGFPDANPFADLYTQSLVNALLSDTPPARTSLEAPSNAFASFEFGARSNNLARNCGLVPSSPLRNVFADRTNVGLLSGSGSSLDDVSVDALEDPFMGPFERALRRIKL